MMKSTYLLSLATAGVLLAPRLQTATGSAPDVARALKETQRALDELADVRDALGRGAPDSVERLLAVTEPAAEDARARDEFLVSLRNEVSRLQLAVDEDATPSMGREPADADDPLPLPTREAPTGASSDVPATVTTGMDAALLQSIRRAEPPLARISQTALRGSSARAFEPEDYVADAIRQARLYFRAGRYAEAMTLLEGRAEHSLEARYWTARCLERTGHVDEALEHLRRVIDGTEDESLRRRAVRDHDFLTWKRDFQQSRGGKDER